MWDSHISEIIDYGYKMASHVKTHSNLANLNDYELIEKIVGSKIEKEEKFLINIKEFIIP